MNKPRTRAIAGVDMGIQAKKDLEVAARSMGLSLSGLFKQGVNFYLSFSPDFRGKVSLMAQQLGIKETFLIERLSLCRLAEMASEVENQSAPRILQEFAPGLSATEFYNYWKVARCRSRAKPMK